MAQMSTEDNKAWLSFWRAGSLYVEQAFQKLAALYYTEMVPWAVSYPSNLVLLLYYDQGKLIHSYLD